MIKSFSQTISTFGAPLESTSVQVESQDFKEKKSSFQVLKNNKIPLTPEERTIVMKRKAVWHFGPHGEATPAVWKTKDSHGNIIFVVNTHHAWNSSKTLLGCINRYHKFIKSTA